VKLDGFLAVLVAAGGGLYLFSRTVTGAALAPSFASLGLPEPYTSLTPAQQVALNTAQQQGSGPGNAPIVAGAPFNGNSAQVASVVDTTAIGVTGLLAHAGVFGVAGGLTAGAVTLGIGLAVAFFTYEWLKQQQSIATNRTRDTWTAQFLALHTALGLTPLTAAQTKGSGPGDLEMAEVIFYFDHDGTQRLWHAVQSTQNEAQFAVAARAVDIFLKARGVPVTGP
jgi:hypothetical protein